MCAPAARLAAQQSQPSLPATPDSPAIVEQLNRLKTSVGARWADAVHFWCEAPRANRAVPHILSSSAATNIRGSST
jgi:hypothetical protein